MKKRKVSRPYPKLRPEIDSPPATPEKIALLERALNRIENNILGGPRPVTLKQAEEELRASIRSIHGSR